MSRAFVTEQDGWNYCLERKQNCKDASLRGECERNRCKYPPEKPAAVKTQDGKTEE